MKLSKKIAGVLTGALAIGSIAAVAPAAEAYTSSVPATLYCDVAGISTSVATWTVTGGYTVNVNGSPSPSNVIVGSANTASITYSNGPNNGGPAVVGRADATIQILSGSTVIDTVTTAWSADAAVSGGGQFPGATLTANFNAPASAGSYTVRVLNVLFEGYLGSGGVGTLPSGVLGAAVSCNANNAPSGTYATNNPTNNPTPFGATTLGVNGPTATVATSSGQPAGAQAIGRAGSAIPYTRVVTMTGTLYNNSVSSGVTVAFCDVTGTSCDTTPAVTNTLVTDGSGNLSGAITIPPGTVPTTGVRYIKISGASASPSLSQVLILTDPSLTVSPTAGGPGSTTAVSGSNFNVSTAVVINASDSAGTTGAANSVPAGAATSDANGAFGPTNFTITAPAGNNTKSIFAVQNGPILGPPSIAQASARTAFAVSQSQCIAATGTVPSATPCDTKQTVYATILSGQLSQQATKTGINPSATAIVFCNDLSDTDTSGTQPGNNTNCGLSVPTVATPMYGTLNKITVTDTRGGTTPWSLVATLPTLTAGSKSIASGAVAITPTCASTNANSAPGATAAGGSATATAGIASSVGTSQTFAAPVTLCTKNATDNAGNGSNGGVWDVTGPMILTVPAFQAAGQYSSVLNVNLA